MSRIEKTFLGTYYWPSKEWDKRWCFSLESYKDSKGHRVEGTNPDARLTKSNVFYVLYTILATENK